MKKSVYAVVLFMSLFLSSLALAQQIEYKKVYQLGLAPLKKGGVKTTEEVKSLILKERAVIDLLLRGRKDLIEEFYRQFSQMKIVDEITFDRSDQIRLLAMSWRNWNKEPKITVPVELAVEGTVKAYVFKVDYAQIQKSYWFLVPKSCGNISFWKIEDLVVPKIEIEKPVPIPVKTSTPAITPTVAPTIVPVIEKATPAEPELQEKKEARMDCFVDVGGGIFRSCSQEYFFLRGGFRKEVVKNLEFNFLVGINFPVNLRTKDPDIEKWKIVTTGDMTLIFRPSPLFFGTGLGISSAMKNDTEKQFEGIGIVGYSIGKIDLFAEARIPIQKGEKINKNHKILFGARLRWGK